MKHHYFDEHHIVPKSRNGTNDPDNKKMAEYNLHHNFHTVFGNLAPHEQIVELLKWNSQALEKPPIECIMDLISEAMRKDVFYLQSVIRNKLNNNIVNPLK
jgi:hypothetical protein